MFRPTPEREQPGEEGDDDTFSEGPPGASGHDPRLKSVRVDKWLWAARMFKTRTSATESCDGGHVRVNEGGVKPAHAVKLGDRVEVVTPGGLRVLEVVGLAEKRGPASVARTLYVDHSPPPPPRTLMASIEREHGRLDRRDRRDAQQLRGRW